MSTIFWIIAILVPVVSFIGMWFTFQKAGEKGWKAIIPIYNIYIFIRLSGHSGWWLALLLLPVVIITLGAVVVGNFDAAIVGSEAGQARLTGLAGLAVNLFTVSVQMIVVTGAIIAYDFARSFGKGLGFTLGLSVLPFIFWPILGFGKAKYRGPVAHPHMVAKGSGAHLPVEKKDTTPVEKKEESSSDSDKEDKKEAEKDSSEN